jgi:hypothetical protein
MAATTKNRYWWRVALKSIQTLKRAFKIKCIPISNTPSPLDLNQRALIQKIRTDKIKSNADPTVDE